jgi:calcium-dependent protein kinase
MTAIQILVYFLFIIAGFILSSLVLYYLYLYISDYLNIIKQRKDRENWRSSYINSIRGNFVRIIYGEIETDYLIETEVGRGGCGVVCIGVHKVNKNPYAIKSLIKSKTDSGRLEREIRLLKDVDHTNIVRLFSAYDGQLKFYFVMELCTGGHLGTLLSRQPNRNFDENKCRILIKQLISAVSHIHSRGICHRDIKLQNILLENNEMDAQVKLIDFGFASRYIGALPMKTRCGTLYCTAPEVLRESYDHRCDIWSIGVVLFIILSGKRPFESLVIAGPLSDAGKAVIVTNILTSRWNFDHNSWHNVSSLAQQFVTLLLHPDYLSRMYADEVLNHPWLNNETISIINGKSCKNDILSQLKSNKSIGAVNNIINSVNSTKLCRTGKIAIVFGSDPKQSNKMRDLFQSFDSDSSGTLSLEEFKQAINIISPTLSFNDIQKIFEVIDFDGDKSISYTEFLAATLDPREIDIGDLNRAFSLMDQDGNGFITFNEIRKVLNVRSKVKNIVKVQGKNGFRRENSNSVLDLEECEDTVFSNIDSVVAEMIEEFDQNKDGVISHEEFLWAMLGANDVLGDFKKKETIPIEKHGNYSLNSSNLSLKDYCEVDEEATDASYHQKSVSNNNFHLMPELNSNPAISSDISNSLVFSDPTEYLEDRFINYRSNIIKNNSKSIIVKGELCHPNIDDDVNNNYNKDNSFTSSSGNYHISPRVTSNNSNDK